MKKEFNFNFTKIQKDLKKFSVNLEDIKIISNEIYSANSNTLCDFLYMSIYSLREILKVVRSSGVIEDKNESEEYNKYLYNITSREYAKILFETCFISSDYIGGAFYFPNTETYINCFNKKYKFVALIPEVKKLSINNFRALFNFYILLRDENENDLIIEDDTIINIYYRNKKIEKILQAQQFRIKADAFSPVIDIILKKYEGKTAGGKTKSNFNNELQEEAKKYNLNCYYSFYYKQIEISDTNRSIFMINKYNDIIKESNKFIYNAFNIQVEQIDNVSDFIKHFEEDNIKLEVECKKLYQKIRDLKNKNCLIFQENRYISELYSLEYFYNRLED